MTKFSFVANASTDHDRGTGVADRVTTTGGEASAFEYPDRLQNPLERVRLKGAIFLRAEYREPWAYESMSGPATANFLQRGSDRVVLFHVVASGTCWVAVDGGEKHWASAGDVIVLPYGDQHQMGGLEVADVVPITAFMPPAPWTQMPVLRHGQDGRQTDLVCGYLHSEDTLFNPAMRALPSVFVVRPPAGAAAQWVHANIAYAMQQTSASPPGQGGIPTRLSELLLIEVLRQHLASAPAVERGWAAALRDPVVAPALALLHRRPQHKWTVAELAQAASVSRSLLDARFRAVLGRSPIRYLTQWRMHVAQNLLATTDLSVLAVARRVGYDAEEAFSRAFKRDIGSSPSVWRTAHYSH
ncbi:MAG TPA: AraC family transcriptional regulator [Acidothermaceae bacterium]